MLTLEICFYTFSLGISFYNINGKHSHYIDYIPIYQCSETYKNVHFRLCYTLSLTSLTIDK